MTMLHDDLSERESEILRLLATGASNKDISTQLAISPNTVKVHLRNIFAKIGVSSRTEAALYALKTGLAPSAGFPDAPEADLTLAPEALDEPLDLSTLNGAEGFAPPVDAPAGWTAPVPGPAPSLRRRAWLWLGAGLGALALLLAAWWAWRASQPAGSGLSALPEDSTRWRALASLPTPRYGMAVTAYEGLIYAIGGQTEQGLTGVVERYDPTRDSWTNLTSKLTPVDEIGCAILGGKIYVPGGQIESGQTTNVLEVYDPRSDAWQSAASLPVGLSAYALAAFEGRLYLFGGWDGQQFVDTVYRYDPGLDQWAQAGVMPSPRGYAGAAVIGRKIFLLGGYNGHKALDENLTYQPDLAEGGDPWGAAQPLPSGRYGMGVSVIAEIVEVVGGIQEGESEPLSLSYFPINDTWREFGQLETAHVLYPGSAAAGNYLYIFGGRVDGKPTGQHQAYQAIYTVSFPIIR